MRRNDGWCLVCPKGKLIADTYAPTKSECWERSFSYLYHRNDWMRPYWKRLAASVRVAAKNGYVMRKVSIRKVHE